MAVYMQFRGYTYDPKDTYRAVGRTMECWIDTLADRALLPQVPTRDFDGGSIAICKETDTTYVLWATGWEVL
ncbi:MAG: hypothetical protein FWH12_02475 [Treponema sp.]|nr:hypothetical protein [Treponema sp.]